MKYYLIIILTTISFSVAGQKSIYLYFNDVGFCGPGPLISEQITLFTDNTFEYFSNRLLNLTLEASGHYNINNICISLEYEIIKIDTLDKSRVNTEIKMNLISEVKVVSDKQWLENQSGMLIECGKEFGSQNKALEPKKRRLIITKTVDYISLNK